MKLQKIILAAFFSVIAISISFAKSEVDEKLLCKMYEEEKMSYDLYTEYYNRWGLEVFNNVRESELIHTQRISELIEKHCVSQEKFVYNNLPGVYNNKEVQKLYDEYTVKGCISDISALMTAALMEETDIYELRSRMSLFTDDYVIRVLTQLEKASQNHLIAFVKDLKKSGVEYTPKVLSKKDYDSIINFNKEKGIISKAN